LKKVETKVKFVSAQPLLDLGLDWLIIGAQTGGRATQPLNTWLDDLMADAKYWRIKIFCKDNLAVAELPGGLSGDLEAQG
jgi:protein gp37